MSAKKAGKYKKLLTHKRSRESTYKDRDLITEAESDRARLIFCPAFRRLQQKAQVFSMEPNAAVRSRLTHSLEVSQVGRYIAELIVKKLKDKRMVSESIGNTIVKFVENACLMHDIGNPPFGHFGEAAISKWFHDNGSSVVREACNASSLAGRQNEDDPRVCKALSDFYGFDGNPQGLRVVTKLQRNSDEYGLNLTYTTIAAYLKYIRGSSLTEKNDEKPFTKKCGYFNTEVDIVQSIWSEFGYEHPQRFPLAYIMEAADDLAYCISDMEDSIEKGLLIQRVAFTEISEKWKNEYRKKIKESPYGVEAKFLNYFNCLVVGKDKKKDFTFTDFRTSINREIAEYAAKQYVKNHDAILKGLSSGLISDQSVYGRFLSILKEFCKQKVYSHESVQIVELAGYRAIYGLLEHFRCILSCDYKRFQSALNYENNKDASGAPIVIEKKLLKLFPKNYVKVYWDDLGKLDASSTDYHYYEWNIRAHLVVDFISGMTDDFSMDMYRELSGMKL